MTGTSGEKNYLILLGHLGALLTVSAWGSSFLSTKIMMETGGFTPVEMYIYRFAFAYIILLFCTFRKFFANSWKDELQLAACGLCAGSIYFVTENYALKFTSTGNVSLLASLSPLMTTLLISVIYKVRLKPGVLIGSVVAILGVASIILSSGEGFVIQPKGDILALSAALSWAIYTIAVKRLVPLYNSFFITRKLFFYGVVSALPLLLIQREPLHLAELVDFSHPTLCMNFLFLALFCSLGAYLVWNEAMKILGPVISSNYLYLQPLVTLVAAFFILHEKVTLLGYIGCALIIGGLLISDKLKWERKSSR